MTAETPEPETPVVEVRHTFDVLLTTGRTFAVVASGYGQDDRSGDFLFHNDAEAPNEGTGTIAANKIAARVTYGSVVAITDRCTQPERVTQFDGRGLPVPGAERSSWLPCAGGS